MALVYGNCWIVDQRKKTVYIYSKKKLPSGFISKELLRTTQYVWDLSLLRKAYLKNCLMIIII